MKTNFKPQDRTWPRENAKITKPRTTRSREFEQDATERTEFRKAKSSRAIFMEVCRSLIGVMSSVESALCSLGCLLFKPIWLRAALFALCVFFCGHSISAFG